MELWERSEALSLLGDLLRESARGGRIALVAGEAGIGKSALVSEFARRCGPGLRVRLGCLRPPGDPARPRSAARHRPPDRRPAGRPAARGGAAGGDLRGLPRRAVVPAYAALHRWWWSRTRTGRTRRRWTGWPSSAAGSTGCRRCCSSPTAATRWDRTTRSAACWRRCPRGRPSRADRAALPRMRRRAGPPGGPRRAVGLRLAGGNPLLVTELLKSRAGPVPGAVQDLILDRIRALPPPARDARPAGRGGARPAPTTSWSPTAAEQVDVCIAAGVLVPAGPGRRRTGTSSCAVRWRTRCRRFGGPSCTGRVLQALVDRPEADPGRLVHHAWLAGRPRGGAALRPGRGPGGRPPGCSSGGDPALPGGRRVRRAASRTRSTPSCSSGTPTRRT